jgi:type IV secretory pathway VirB6-like protein
MMRALYTLIVLAMVALWSPQAAEASAPTPTPAPSASGICDFNHNIYVLRSTLAGRVVICVEQSIKGGMNKIMNAASATASRMMYVLITLVIIIHGIRIMGGEKIGPSTIGLAVRIGLVTMFAQNLGGYSDLLFNVTNSLITFVIPNPHDLWQAIDNFMGRLFGFGPNIALFNGVLALIGGSLFSSAFGFLLFMVGFSALISILLFIFQAVFVYLMSITIIAFMIMISPIIIPLAVFRIGDNYLRPWLELVFSAILTPVLLFAFLGMFLSIFDTEITTILSGILNKNPAMAYMGSSQPLLQLFSSLTDSSIVQHIGATAGAPTTGGTGPKLSPTIGAHMTPLAQNAISGQMWNVSNVNFGPNDAGIKTSLAYSFLSIWVFSMLMKNLIERIPDIASSIGGASTGIQLGNTSLHEVSNKMNANMMKLGQQQ